MEIRQFKTVGVSILVLMEEALRLMRNVTTGCFLYCFNPCFNGRGVKTSRPSVGDSSLLCFNPCFNGRGVKTNSTAPVFSLCDRVSILVLMEEALRHSDTAGSILPHSVVSILVLMEEALRPIFMTDCFFSQSGFNPCFNGRGVKTFVLN